MFNKVVLITGSTGGLGNEIARGMAAQGYSIALHYHLDKKYATELESSLNVKEKKHKIFQSDLTDELSIEKMLSDIIEHFGRIDIVINNAGISFSGISWKQTSSEWNRIFAVNATSVFLVSKYAVPYLRKQEHARIINISSVVANKPMAGTSAYAASKAAVEGFTKAQAVELSRFGITANCIAPGYFDNGMIREIDEETRKKIIEEIPIGRLGQAAELTECILYLCNENTGYLTGQVIQLNGGLYLK